MSGGAVAGTWRLAVTRRLPEPLQSRLGDGGHAWINADDRPLGGAGMVDVAAQSGADVLLVTATDRLDETVIAALPARVRAIATLSVGHDHIDLAAARRRDIAVVSTPDILSDAVAEMAMLLLLGAARRAHEGARLLYEGLWTGWSPTQLLGRDVTGARLGIFGMGRIGRTVAVRGGRGFDMDVHYHNRSRASDEAGATYHADAADLLAVSDFLVLTAPSTPQTKGFLDAAAIARLPRGAIVVNVARGDLVDDEALLAALHSGQVGAAGLDVFNGEPTIHPGYLAAPNVFLQPHQGSSTMGTRVRMGELLLDSVDTLMAGGTIPNRLV